MKSWPLPIAATASGILVFLTAATTAPSAYASATSLFNPERGLPLLQRFLPETYAGHYQINDLAVALDGRLYGASQRAVHRFDGIRWERLDFPGLWAWRITASADGRIFVSGDDEIGFFADSDDGSAKYRSLKERVPVAALPLGSIRGARAAGRTVAFAAGKGWLVWERDSFHFEPSPEGSRTSVYAVGDTLFAGVAGGGLRRWDGHKWQPFAAGTPLDTATVTGLTSLPEGNLLALVSPPALLAVDVAGQTARPWTGPVAAALLQLRPLGLLALPDGTIASFTRSAGLVFVTPDATALLRFDKTHGLPSNTTYGLALDREGGLWTGGTSGLVRLDLATPASVFDERNGPGPGGMRSFARQDGVLYAGVVETLHRLVPADLASGTPARFEPIPGPATTVSDLAAHPAGLLVATGSTLSRYRPDSGFEPLLRRPDNLTVVWTTPDDPDRVFLGGERSLAVARPDATGLSVEFETDIPGSVELITPAGPGTIWIGTRARGFFRLRAAPEPAGWRAPTLEHFDAASGLPPTRGYTAVFRAPWGPSFFTSEGTWQLDETSRRFSPEPAFRLADGPLYSFPGTLDAAGRWWASGGRLADPGARPLGWYSFPDGTPRRPAVWHAAPPSLQPLAGATGFLTFFRDAEGSVVWGKSPQGVVRLETARIAASPAPVWKLRLQRILADDRECPLFPSGGAGFPAGTGRLGFRFSPGRLDAGPLTWRTRLVGHESAWSAPSPYPEVTYIGLEGGPFTLEAVAVDASGRTSEPLRYVFRVAPPWHRTPAARVGYLLAFVGLTLGFVRWRLDRAERERRRLENVVAERTRDLAAARDQAEAASRAKSAFLAAMSHELRTPLNGVIGYAQLLQTDSRLAADQRERLRLVHQSGEHLLRMINDVLDLAKIEAGKIELRPVPFALGELLADVAAGHADAAVAKGLAFESDVAPDLPSWVEGDPQKLRQVLDNLIGNAVKFTLRGRIVLRVHRVSGPPATPAAPPAAPRLPAASDFVGFAVADTGPGICAADRERLFQPFEQARATRPAAPGTGLGLAIARALVECLGGKLEVASTAGHGSTFAFALPLPSAAPASAPRSPAISGYEGPRRRVLLVDDHAVNRQLLADLLVPLGFDCLVAASGPEALDRLADGSAPWPDLAILDLRMDGLDGLELTRRLRALPRGAELRVILTSASVLSFDPAAARTAGCDDFLPKPFRTSELLGKIGSLLALRWQEVRPPGPAESDPSSAAPLPESARAALRDVLAQGDLEAFRAALVEIRAAHPATAGLCRALDDAAAGFQLSRLRTLLD